MKLIVGLGNPEKKYDNTRHNIGFMILDKYLSDANYKEKFNGLYIEKNIKNEKVIFLKPLTYMNNSGFCVEKFVNFFKIKIDDILVIHDDLDLDFGKFRLKKNSSSGGHNGIKSIIQCLGTNEFSRLKIGINNSQKENVIDFVLGKFSKEELSFLNNNYIVYNNIIDSFILNGLKFTLDHLNNFRGMKNE